MSTMSGRDGRARKNFNENADQTNKSDVQKTNTMPSFGHANAARRRLTGTGSIASDGLKVGAKQGTQQATMMDAAPRVGVVKPKIRPAKVRRVPGA